MLCPAGCELALSPGGPDQWHVAYPLQGGRGLCPRGSALAELLNHRGRVLTAGRRTDGELRPLEFAAACRAVRDAAGERGVVVLLDANYPCEQLVAAAEACRNWRGARLSLVMEPSEEELLRGTEASGAEYLSDEALKDCDGFVIVGDAFAANPVCSRGVFDRRRDQPRTPIVVIDPAAGSATKFATHPVACPPGGELAALRAVAAASGQDASAAAAGAALAGCRRLGVLLAAEYGRGGSWRAIGQAAGQLAKARGGGVAVQTSGANALAAVRLAAKLQALPLGDALAGDGAFRIAIGADVVGMLGGMDVPVAAAAAPLPNCTTDRAEIVLPVAMAVECGGTWLSGGAQPVRASAVMAPPAGVPTPGELVAALASGAGVGRAQTRADVPPLERLSGGAPGGAPAAVDPPKPALLLGRQALHAGCGALTAGASWQAAMQPLPELRMSPSDAEAAGIQNLATVTVRAGGQSLRAAARIAPELPPGTVVLPEGRAEARRLSPCRVDSGGAVVAAPVAAEVAPTGESGGDGES